MSFSAPRLSWLSPFSRGAISPPVGLRLRLRSIRDLLDQGEVEAASQATETLITEAPYNIHVLALTARCQTAKGDHEAAVQIYDRLLTQQDSDLVWAAKARSLVALNRYHRAASCFARATALVQDETYASEHADCLRAAGKLTQALKLLSIASDLSSPDLKRQLVHAKILSETGNTGTAFKLARRAVVTDKTGVALAIARQNMPDEDTYADLCRQAAKHHSSAALLAEVAIDHPNLISTEQIKRLSQTSRNPECDDTVQATAFLALFRIDDNSGNRLGALAHLRKYHALSAAHLAYKRRYDSALFTVLTRLNFEPLRLSKSKTLPIFVTGLPGSGSQQAAHILAQAAGDGNARPLSLIPAVMSRLIRQLRTSGRREINREEMLNLQAELRDGVQQAAQGRKIVIDTTPLNFRWSGIIAAALPEARIVQMKRDPMTTGWALHKGGFRDSTLGCQHDLKEIQAFQHRSTALMTHWEERSAHHVIGISGDTLSRPNIATAQTMVEHCHLKWSTQCSTPPYYPDRSWHRYAAYLNPLRQRVASPLNLTCDQSTK